jgi:hypothetical protein
MTNHFSMLNDEPKSQLSEKTIWMLQQVRRANSAIIGCIEILNEDGVNDGCAPNPNSVFIRLEVHQKMGLHYAIEACSRDIARIFDDHLEEIGVEWLDEIRPDIRAAEEAGADLINGKITRAEYEQRTDH